MNSDHYLGWQKAVCRPKAVGLQTPGGKLCIFCEKVHVLIPLYMHMTLQEFCACAQHDDTRPDFEGWRGAVIQQVNF